MLNQNLRTIPQITTNKNLNKIATLQRKKDSLFFRRRGAWCRRGFNMILHGNMACQKMHTRASGTLSIKRFNKEIPIINKSTLNLSPGTSSQLFKP